MHSDNALVAHLFGGCHGGGKLGGVVGIIIYHGGTVAFALNLKPAAGAVKLCRGALGIGGLHGQRIVNVVVARNTQLDVGKLLAQLQNVKFIETGAVFLNVHCAEAGFLIDAEREHRAVNGVDHIHRVAVVHVEHDRAGKQGKLLERHLQAAHRAVILQVIVINVQNNAHKRGQMQESLTVFAGFDHNVIAVASFAVTADQWQLAADYGGGVFAGQFQHGRDHAGGGGFAVGAGNADAVGIHAADITQHHAALHGGNAAGAGSFQLRVFIMDGGAVNHQLGIAQMGGVMLQIYCHAHGALGLGDLGFFHIAAGNGQPAAVQDLDQGIGSGTAAADKMHMLHTIKQMGIIAADKRHKFHLKKIRHSRSCQPGNQFVWRMAL